MRYIHELTDEINVTPQPLDGCPVCLNHPNRVNILALGDVGTTMLIGLRLLGSDVISEIGICDIRQDNTARLEMEINQIGYPFTGWEDPPGPELPPVKVITEKELFDCEVMIFCASKGVPPVEDHPDDPTVDVRMVQLDANREIIRHFADLANKADYRGLVCIVSDPVDNLAAAFCDASGLKPWQIQGYGLGVMNMRAAYYAERMGGDCAHYAKEGRAFGPHGEDLVIANSLAHYDDEKSQELTRLTVEANLRVRELGFKPYIAPALSSAAISILLTLRGQWHYGSVYLGDCKKGAFLGIRNRLTPAGWEYEDAPMPDVLYERVKRAYLNLCQVR